MSSPLEIPEPGSPLDIARAIAYDPDVQHEIRSLMITLRAKAKQLGVSAPATMRAIDLAHLDPTLDDLISMQIEERFAGAIVKEKHAPRKTA